MPGDVLYTIEKPQHGTGYFIVWASLTQDQRLGESYPRSGERSSGWWADKSVHVRGTFGGAPCVIQGSNDEPSTTTSNIVFTTLTDTSDNNLLFTVMGAEQVAQNMYHIRPILPTTNGNTSIQVRMFVTTARGEHHD